MNVKALTERFPPLVRVRRLAAAVPVWAWLLSLVAVAAVARAAVAKTHMAPWIFDDELIYWKLSSSFAESGHFAVRSVQGLFGYAPGYPLLISPAHFVFGDAAHAYAAAKAINALVMSLGAIPAYLIARRLVRPWPALLAGVCALALPSLEYTGTIMTENAFYPAFLLCAWGFMRMFERPTVSRQLVALGLIALATSIRVQAVLFAAVLACSIVLVVLADAHRARAPWRWRTVLRRFVPYRVTLVALAAGAILAVVVQVARGRSFSGLLGAYGDVTGWDYSVTAILRWALYHVAELDLYSGFLPFAAFLVVTLGAFRKEETSRELTAFAAMSLGFFVWLILPAAALSSHLALGNGGVGRIEERNVFYLVALFAIATVVWAERGLPRGRLGAAAAVLAAALPGVLPLRDLVNLSALSDTLAFIPLARLLIDGSLDPAHLSLAVVLAALVGTAAFLFLPRRAALAAPLAMLAFFIWWQVPLERQMKGTSNGVLTASINTRREWIDERAGGGAQVAALWTGNVSPTVITVNEFFNRSVRRVYSVEAPPLPAQLPEIPATVDEGTGLLVSGGARVQSDWVLADRTLEIRGRAAARDEGIGTTLYRTAGEVGLRARTTGLYGDAWSAGSVTHRRWGCDGGALVVTLRNYPGLVDGRQTVVARSAAGTVRTSFGRRAGLRQLVVSLPPGACSAVFTVKPTAVPATVLGTPDTRELGVHFDSISYRPAR
ncbi:MAG: glycosyltransferase family 39 protein [Actinomycetota bacterium]|nr:glycosyltransferase family 39 protein [Actinomycetota bacterium]